MRLTDIRRKPREFGYAKFQVDSQDPGSNTTDWFSVILQSSFEDTIGATKNGNQITLPAGTYIYSAYTKGIRDGWGANVLYDVTNGVFFDSTNTRSITQFNSTTTGTGESFRGTSGYRFSIPQSTTFEIRRRNSANPTGNHATLPDNHAGTILFIKIA